LGNGIPRSFAASKQSQSTKKFKYHDEEPEKGCLLAGLLADSGLHSCTGKERICSNSFRIKGRRQS
jgi:hypothetical protein